MEPAETTYEFARNLHDLLVIRKIVRMNTDGKDWWVEYADRFTGTWKQIK